MKKRILYIVWGLLYALCAGLGHVSQPGDVQSIAMTLISLLFFVPPAILLIDALRSDDRKTLLQLRLISIVSLVLTFILLILNVGSMLASEIWGTVLHEMLIFVSVPMICSRYWILSLFLWALLLFITIPPKKKS
jgi:hypothetical protein